MSGTSGGVPEAPAARPVPGPGACAALVVSAAVTPASSERLAGILADVCRRADATADRVPDALLAAVALDLDAELVTADRGFARYEGLRWRHPLEARPPA